MPRPTKGYYRKGVDHSTMYRRCDACGVKAVRSLGRYVQTSATRQVWCCVECAPRKIAKVEARMAA